jgi:hypothetical protein
MNFNEFRQSLTGSEPPEEVTPLLSAMWWEAKGKWERAHGIAQDVGSVDGAWVHAYLHRKEGDEGNAGYWYGQARRPHSHALPDAEWEQIVRALLEDA